MMKFKASEATLEGKWNFDGKFVKADENCERIHWLINNYLVKVATDESGWEILYQSPDDKRYWELTYPHSEMQGGGPPKLTCLSGSDVRAKYKI